MYFNSSGNSPTSEEGPEDVGDVWGMSLRVLTIDGREAPQRIAAPSNMQGLQDAWKASQSQARPGSSSRLSLIDFARPVMLKKWTGVPSLTDERMRGLCEQRQDDMSGAVALKTELVH